MEITALFITLFVAFVIFMVCALAYKAVKIVVGTVKGVLHVRKLNHNYQTNRA